MITIFHGDDFTASRHALNQAITQAKQKNLEIIRLDGDKLTETDLVQALESASLFAQDKLIVLENLKKDLLKIILRNSEQSIYLWEKKKTVVPKGAIAKEFKLTKTIYKFLDTFNLTFFEETRKTEAVELVFYLFHRRVSQLIQAKNEPDLLTVGWQKTKLINQAKKFSLEKLIELHRELLTIEWEIKSGQSGVSLQTRLELLLTNL